MSVKTTLMNEIPDCDLCKSEKVDPPEPAEYDAKTIFGPHGYLCESHFQSHGFKPMIGTKLVLRGSAKQPDELVKRADALCRRCGMGCGEDSWNKETGRYRVLDSPAKIEVMLATGLYCEEIGTLL